MIDHHPISLSGAVELNPAFFACRIPRQQMYTTYGAEGGGIKPKNTSSWERLLTLETLYSLPADVSGLTLRYKSLPPRVCFDSSSELFRNLALSFLFASSSLSKLGVIHAEICREEKRHININFLFWLTSRWPWDKRLVVPELTGPKSLCVRLETSCAFFLP